MSYYKSFLDSSVYFVELLKAVTMHPAISFVWLALGLHSVFNLVDLQYSEVSVT